jgi:hypothetical protein
MAELAITLFVTIWSRPPPPVVAVSPGPPRCVIVSVTREVEGEVTVSEYLVAFDDVDVMVTTAPEEVALMPAF